MKTIHFQKYHHYVPYINTYSRVKTKLSSFISNQLKNGKLHRQVIIWLHTRWNIKSKAVYRRQRAEGEHPTSGSCGNRRISSCGQECLTNRHTHLSSPSHEDTNMHPSKALSRSLQIRIRRKICSYEYLQIRGKSSEVNKYMHVCEVTSQLFEYEQNILFVGQYSYKKGSVSR